jgi:hypothetical protein
VFSVSDPRIASDIPRTEITAKQLLDLSSTRIETKFSDQPEMQIELLGVVADIYQRLRDDERYVAIQQRRIALARAHYGSMHPVVIQGLVTEADAAFVRQDFAKAERLLDEIDALLKASGQDQSLMRANWWRIKARALTAVANSQAQRAYAADQAVALYARLAPHSMGYAQALNVASRNHAEPGEYVAAKLLAEQAVAVAMAAQAREPGRVCRRRTRPPTCRRPGTQDLRRPSCRLLDAERVPRHVPAHAR